MTRLTVTVDPICIPFGSKSIGRLRLHKLQEETHKLVNEGRSVVLSSPTGSGKTLTLLLAEDYGGAVGIYPNNTLLINQRDSLRSIIEKHSGIGKCIEYYDTGSGTVQKCKGQAPDTPLLIFKIDDSNGVLSDYKHIAILTVSGKTIPSPGESPATSKRELVYSLIEKALSYKDTYTVTLTTPDTFLLLYSGAYRDFETVGKLIHNLLQLISTGASPNEMENIIRKTATAARSTLAPIIGLRARLLEYPLFIDEFHLYGAYELDALYAILKLNKEVALEEYPVVFSSATPAQDTINELTELLEIDLSPVSFNVVDRRCRGFMVRGRTTVEIIGVDVGVRGLGAYYHVGDHVPQIILNNYSSVLADAKNGNIRAMIILDRVYQVYKMVESLVTNGYVPVKCHVSIPHPACSSSAGIIVGSQRLTQGVDIENVKFLAMTAVGAEDAVQRFGRSGRGGLDSHVVLFAAERRVETIRQYDNRRFPYSTFVSKVLGELYLDITSRSREWSKNYKDLHTIKRKLMYAITVTSLARVAGQYRLFSKVLKEIDRSEASNIKDYWIYGGPDTLAYLLRFRKTGFRVKYKIKGNGEVKEDDIGVIIRNARVRVQGGILEIDPWNAPTRVKDRDILVLDATTVKERLLRGRITRLKYLMDRHGVEVLISNIRIKPSTDTLLFFPMSPPKKDYMMFWVQSGEAILTELGRIDTIAFFL